MVNDLINLGCFQRKSLILKYPEESQVPRHLQRHFVRGYWDGDGCISKTTGFRKRSDLKNPREGGYEYTQLTFKIIGTKEFLTGCCNNVFEVMPNKLLQNNNKNNYDLKFGGNAKVKKIMNSMYVNASIFLDRKKILYDTYITE